ncbi:serine protease Do [Ruminococcus sp. YRD2003]|uniref:S1C family serine protease n=1 Tax=Ruminococcus sp. YRD2003 TaxID=1452313 RepID=UPI0008C1B9A1|nr:serine protease Do [Ruminococcus flavefaciens]
MDDNNIYTGGGIVPPASDNTYIPKHEKAPAPQQEQPAPAPQPPRPHRPVYDSFMYEPIGFDEYDRMSAAEIKADEERRERKLRTARERAILVLFFLMVLLALTVCIVGITADLIRSKDHMKAIGGTNVVLYQNSKPEGANDLENFVDENGRYTTEGAAAAVKESIVEIYTYSDPFRSTLKGTGSGVVLTADGYIVTNAHVLLADGYHDIHTCDNKVYNAKIVGRDAKTDIAVIKVNNAELCPAVLGDSDEVIVGEKVIAVGNPAGLSNTVTDGIVSAVGRKIRSDSTGFEMNCIQTNAAISPGNSGGALVNMYGQVIGITSSKYVSSSYEGLGFAITINDSKPIIEELISNGFIGGRFRIGITLVDMSSESKIETIEEKLGFPIPEGFEGVYIDAFDPNCDIANTDLKAGDFITAINGKSIKTYDDLYDTISASYAAGDKVPATCAHVTKDGDISYYNIEFKLMPDTSGDF